jgi:hypothetical protein
MWRGPALGCMSAIDDQLLYAGISSPRVNRVSREAFLLGAVAFSILASIIELLYIERKG